MWHLTFDIRKLHNNLTDIALVPYDKHVMMMPAKASDGELWNLFWSTPEPTVKQTMDTPVVWDTIASLWRHVNGIHVPGINENAAWCFQLGQSNWMNKILFEVCQRWPFQAFDEIKPSPEVLIWNKDQITFIFLVPETIHWRLLHCNSNSTEIWSQCYSISSNDITTHFVQTNAVTMTLF